MFTSLCALVLSQSKVRRVSQVSNVVEVLMRHAKCIYGAFDHFAVLGSVQTAKPDISSINFEAFIRFANNCRLIDSQASSVTIEKILARVDSVHRGTSHADAHNKASSLNRHEFLQMLVRIAAHKYLTNSLTGLPSGDAAAALERLIYENLLKYLPQDAITDGNIFRRRVCYTEPVSRLLTSHYAALWDLFAGRAERSVEGAPKRGSNAMMSIVSWLTLARDADLKQFGVSDAMAMHLFACSRIRSIPNHSARNESKLKSLFFEDFLELLVRLSTVIVRSTDEKNDGLGQVISLLIDPAVVQLSALHNRDYEP